MSFGYGGLMLLDTAGGGMDIFGGMNLFKKLTELTGNVRLPRRGSDEIDCAPPRSDKNGRLVPVEVKKMDYNSSKLAENKDTPQDPRRSPVTKQKVHEHANMTFEEVPLPENTHGLEPNSMVEITNKNEEKLYGVMRWMGHNTKLGSMAGIELEEKLPTGGTDGTLFGNRYFTCETGRAIFVKLSTVRPDSRFPSQTETFSKRKRLTSQDFGGFNSPTLKGYIHPPKKLTLEFVGRQKGIQGDQNSCYLDTTLYSMYAYSNIFDDILHRTKTREDLKEYEDVQVTLRENIVNPLRSYGFVRADRVLLLREYLDQLGTTKGLTNEEKDPEEFLHTFLQEVTRTEPFLQIRQQGSTHVEKSYHYQIFMEKNESYQLPTVEQLLHYSFLHSDLRLTKVPPCLIMQMPRFGKDYRMYNRILPSLYLDISDLLEGWPRICTVCGKLAEFECRDCSGQLEQAGIADAINSYCQDCSVTVHEHRRNHNVKQYQLGDSFIAQHLEAKEKGWSEDEINEKIFSSRKMMELFAVVCIETSHYVAFVKAGTGSDAQWIFFDSMADREGDQQGYNIPEITHLPHFQDWITNEAQLKEKSDKDLPAPLRRLLCDGYMCMYQDPDVVAQYQKQFQQTTPIDMIASQNPIPTVRERSESNEMPMQVDDWHHPSAPPPDAKGVTYNPPAPHIVVKGSTYDPPPQEIVGKSTTYDPSPSPPRTYHNVLEENTPAITYTTHRGHSQGNTGKAAANAALTYRNYADAAASNNRPQRSRARVSSFDNGIDNNTYQQHVGEIGYDNRDLSRQVSADSAHSSSQFVSLPATTSSQYRLSLSEDADLYSRPKDTTMIGGQHHQIHHPPSTRTDYSPNGNTVVADAPIPRSHPTRISPSSSTSSYQYGRYTGNSTSASRLAQHGIKEPPSYDDEFTAAIGNVSLSGTRI